MFYIQNNRFKENYKISEVAFNYGVAEQTITGHKREHDDELIENIHYFYSYEQTKGGRQRIIRWTLEGVYMLGFFIKSEQAKNYRKKVAEFLRLCDEARQKKFNEARATITRQTDKIANLESVLISKQREHNYQINGFKGAIAKKNKLIKDNKLKIYELEKKLRIDDFEDRSIKSVKLLSRVQNDLKQSFLEIGAVMGYLYNGDEFFINQNFKKDKRW